MHLAGIAVLMGMGATSLHLELAPWLNGVLRLAEAAVGIATAVALTLLASPVERLLAARQGAAGLG